MERLTKTHGFTFTDDENEKLKAVFYAFYAYGPSITTRGSAAAGSADAHMTSPISPASRPTRPA